MERNGTAGAAATGGRAAYYARLLPHGNGTGTADETTLESSDAVSRALRSALIPEDRFYRVVKESKLYSIIFPGAASDSNSSSSSRDEESVVVVQEITKHGARSSSVSSSSSRGRRNSVYDQNGASRALGSIYTYTSDAPGTRHLTVYVSIFCMGLRH